MRTKTNYGGLDNFRLAAALLVVAIHTSPLTSLSADADFFLTRILARVAVPFFLMVTGQFVVGRFLNGAGKGKGAPWRYLCKIMLLYLFSILLYLPIGIYAGHYKALTLGTALRMLFFDGTFYHLWYFPACIMGVLLVYLMSRALKLPAMLAVSSLLYLIGLLGDSYFGLVQKAPFLEGIYEFGFQIFSYTRNGLFLAPLFLVLGAWLGTKKDPLPEKYAEKPGHYTAFCLAGLCVSFLLMTAEAFWLRSLEFQRHDSMYLMLVPVMLFLYQSLLCLRAKSRRLLRSAALWVYVLHPAFIVVVRGIAKPLKMTALLVDNSIVHYLAVAVLSLGAGLCMAFLQSRISRRRAQASLLEGVIAACRTRDDSDAWDGEDAAPDGGQANGLDEAADSSGPSGLNTPLDGGRPFRVGGRPRHARADGRAWIQLDMNALSENVSLLRSLMPEGCRLMPAIKANAYGHGAVPIARELNRLGVDAFCVACITEGISLRKAGIKGEILILGYTTPEDFSLLSRYQLTQTVIDYPYAELLAQSGIKLHVHVGIDTGMHRLGIRCENIEDIAAVFEMKNLIIDGMCTHLSSCDSPDRESVTFTKQQIDAFYQVAEILEAQGYSLPRLHLQSSYGLINYPCENTDYVRAGIVLYGVHSSHEKAAAFPLKLSPVLSLMARLVSVRTLHPGDSAGYGMSFTAEKEMRVAVLSIGYADGLPRALSCGRGHVLIHGCKAPIIGKVCMDLTLADISHIPQAQAGDAAVIIGSSDGQEIRAEDLAELCGTITNELLSRLGARLERIVI